MNILIKIGRPINPPLLVCSLAAPSLLAFPFAQAPTGCLCLSPFLPDAAGAHHRLSPPPPPLPAPFAGRNRDVRYAREGEWAEYGMAPRTEVNPTSYKATFSACFATLFKAVREPKASQLGELHENFIQVQIRSALAESRTGARLSVCNSFTDLITSTLPENRAPSCREFLVIASFFPRALCYRWVNIISG